jgi:hypothetical protein
MRAGGSAGVEAQRARLRAEAHEQAAAEQRQWAERMAVASSSELSTARTLAPLTAMGYVQLVDRRWPGSRQANVDLLLIGPSGVYIVDTKCWAEPAIVGGRLLRGQDDVTEELDGLLQLVDLAQGEFAEVGLAPREVLPLVVLAGRSGVNEQIGAVNVVGERDLLAFVLRRGQRLTGQQVDQLVSAAISVFPPMGASTVPISAVVPEPVLPVAEPVEVEELALLTRQDVQDAVLEAALTAPVEDWMTFLHPNQARLVRRNWNGPARIRGAAGTGKTVVGLHRAAYLASTKPGRILFTSFVRTLPQVLRQFYQRLAPDTVECVDFVNVHRFALDLLSDRGIRTRVDLSGANRAYAAAWAQVGKPGALKQVPQPWTYWQEEIDYVIKGRGLTSFEAYATLDRVGRRYPLTVEQRRAVWELYVAYQQQLQERGIHDLGDVMMLAKQQVSLYPPEPRYTSVIVDEVQDLSCVAVRMLHALVGDAADGLLLIGDGQQSVYPGGFTLSEAGVAVTGRAAILRHNYRNTDAILAAASSVVAKDKFSDLESLEELGERDVECVRSGRRPTRFEAEDVATHDQAIVSAIEQAIQEIGVDYGDVAVLAAKRKTLEHYRRVLKEHGIASVDLKDYDGHPVSKVKLGTFKRAKGLEFKHVFLPQPVDGPSTRWTDETDDAYRERIELERRELFVGMTRARDGLWLGFLPSGRA